MDLQYDDIEEWAAATTRGRHIFNYNYRMVGNELRGWELVNSVIMENEPGVTEKIYIWENKASKTQELVRISITELHNWRSAQDRLHAELRHSMRPNIPKASGKLAEVGDVAFVARAHGSDVVAAIFFARGNLAVSVNSVGDKLVDVSRTARMLDHKFSEPPKEEEIKKGAAQVLSPKQVKVRENESIPLIAKLPAPVLRNGWLKIIVPDGEISREDDVLMYAPSKTGENKIEAYLEGENGVRVPSSEWWQSGDAKQAEVTHGINSSQPVSISLTISQPEIIEKKLEQLKVDLASKADVTVKKVEDQKPSTTTSVVLTVLTAALPVYLVLSKWLAHRENATVDVGVGNQELTFGEAGPKEEAQILESLKTLPGGYGNGHGNAM